MIIGNSRHDRNETCLLQIKIMDEMNNLPERHQQLGEHLRMQQENERPGYNTA